MLVAALPLAALALAAAHARHVARALRVRPGRPRTELLHGALVATVFGSLALAAAQPAWTSGDRQRVRTESQVFFVVDVSRSMAAAPALGARSRLERARSVVARLRAAVPAVPAGLAGLTDRVLPYLFPTLDDRAFASTLAHAVTIESPPPQQVSRNATSFDALASLARDDFFLRTGRRRTCVLVTDGETRPFSTASVVGALGGPRGCRLLVVRVARSGERVYGPDGTPEAGYTPDPAASASAATIAGAAGGAAFPEGNVGPASEALRRAADVGAVGRTRTTPTSHALAPYAALLSLAAAAGLVVVRVPLRRKLTEG